MKLHYKLATGVASAALLVSSFAPLASAEVLISGNGSRSSNGVFVSNTNTTSLSQVNRTDVSNDVNISNNTGGNRANGNTGGDVSINTGNAEAAVEIHNMAGSNVASIDSCGCASNGIGDITIVGNGSRSDNYVRADSDKLFRLQQRNDSDFDNAVRVNNETGYNRASDNTSGGYFSNNFSNQDYWNKYNDWMKKFDGNWWKNHSMSDWNHEWQDWKGANGFSSVGDNSIDTGDAQTDVMIHNMGSSNVFGY
jgi:hypothetical protein